MAGYQLTDGQKIVYNYLKTRLGSRLGAVVAHPNGAQIQLAPDQCLRGIDLGGNVHVWDVDGFAIHYEAVLTPYISTPAGVLPAAAKNSLLTRAMEEEMDANGRVIKSPWSEHRDQWSVWFNEGVF